MTRYFVERALLDDQLASDVAIEVNHDGNIETLAPNAKPEGAHRLAGIMIPGLANLHSHAFQRAMAGLTEVAADDSDSFWTWRDRMYQLLGAMTPEQVGIIARYLYIAMLKGGYTQVAEFHYLHHAPDGTHYAGDDMLWQLIHAARESGIGMTLLPALYSWSGFDERSPEAGQRRFIHSTDDYLQLQTRLAAAIRDERLINHGICFHSLRAVSERQIDEVLGSAGSHLPVHIHIAEQEKEVRDCLAWSGQTPVAWLLDHAPVDERWCLVHATHLTGQETAALAHSGAIAGLCPTTEASLGDGLFPATNYLRHGGRWGIGSDSHVSLSVLEELRWLEYGQRLRDRQRNRLATRAQPMVGNLLLSQAASGGAQACGIRGGRLAPGLRADWLLLDDDAWLGACPEAHMINRWLFAGDSSTIRHVWVAGRAVIQDRTHPLEQQAARDFARVMREL
ncbi:formimidoylglutamate deiminase [Jejubacter calystegiae]|uniref:Formimidoylglutamate deiminase n=1 Tax=Jejubacter calystegiae TaxID=2579935 RepID=A0A4P8YH87_9ENTR|nr:formimidoylglutamate deiminase [Jejubacter calystegiae]QCT19068.1 formimidoylglutamate deiminase [Jejubacter calystegiae]